MARGVRAVRRIDGKWSTVVLDAPADADPTRDGADVTWFRAGGRPPDDLLALAKRLDLHPLAVEDVQNLRQRPKVEAYPDHTFVVMRIPERIAGELRWRQTGIFLGPDFVVTASNEPLPELDRLEKELVDGRRRDIDPCRLFYHVLDVLVDAWFPFMDAFEERLEDLEDRILDDADPADLAVIRQAKRDASVTRKVLLPMREAMLQLVRNDHPHVTEEARIFLRDVADHAQRLAERLEHVKEMGLIAQETWTGTLATKQAEISIEQNVVMTRLTVVAAILLVPSLLAGIAGMNFEGVPSWGFVPVAIGIIGIAVVGTIVAKMRRWL